MTALAIPWRAILTSAQNAFASERQQQALWLPVAMGAGILGYFNLRVEPDGRLIWLPPAVIILAVIVARRLPFCGWLYALAAAASFGFAVVLWHAQRAPPPISPPSRALVIEGIVQNVEALPQGLRVTLANARLGPEAPILERSLRLRLRSDDPARPAPGDLLRVRALIRPPAAPAYPGAWDFQRTAYFNGQGGVGFAIGAAEVIPRAGEAPPLSGLRRDLEARVIAALPGPAGAISAALLTGSQSAIPAADLNAMRDSGLAHLLSVSGLHIAIVMSVSFWVCRLLLALYRPMALRVPGKLIAGCAALLAGGFYMLLTGAQVPMQRSFAMACLVTLAILAGRKAISLRGLAWAATVVMLFDPASLLGPSFQMSFAAVLALIAGWEALQPRLMKLRASLGWAKRIVLGMLGLMLTSILAGAATAPFGLAHFGRLQWYGVAANAVAVPLTSFIVMPAGMLAAVLMPLGLEAPALWVMGFGVEGVLWVARIVAAWPGATQAAMPIPAWGLAVFAFGLCWLCLWRRWWRALGVLPMLLGLSSAAIFQPPHILISGDARLIAISTADTLFLQRQPGASSLTRDTWLRLYGQTAAQALPAEGSTAEGKLRCSADGCVLNEGPGAFLVRRGNIMAQCGAVAVIISAEPTRQRCRQSIVIDRFSVWRDGPHAVWLLPAGAEVISDRAWRGNRRWVPPPPQPRAAAEPPAPIE
ncbi:MAG: ComEC/Rec2 family competence protein [Roseomonas sp.]|nr:ComEC/Rec2 family competence protein [Roseomonas sp.]MCA3332624.1 ComEC/Rec2 family competence protein [Roseomonas sp.]MCA3336220.1 ComEC/Rec2 family competence protein [Roseomonas sp.]MCA3346671.1 ComEC/Rec2 family competence protein [Roseomonas sp.]MCA3356326.1 ComEC/Rec2 family competence protein [Roseomonas sp.]